MEGPPSWSAAEQRVGDPGCRLRIAERIVGGVGDTGEANDANDANDASVNDTAESGVDEVRARIAAERRRLQSLVDSLTANFDDLTEAADASPPDDEHDPEGHTIAFERSQLSARRSDYLRTIDELAAAELRLGYARAGLCDRCGEPIPHERRVALPTTTRCVGCASVGSSYSRVRVHP